MESPEILNWHRWFIGIAGYCPICSAQTHKNRTESDESMAHLVNSVAMGVYININYVKSQLLSLPSLQDAIASNICSYSNLPVSSYIAIHVKGIQV